jgi:hypothetical protein
MKRKNQSLPPLENREQWGTPKFKIAQGLAHPAGRAVILSEAKNLSDMIFNHRRPDSGQRRAIP